MYSYVPYIACVPNVVSFYEMKGAGGEVLGYAAIVVMLCRDTIKSVGTCGIEDSCFYFDFRKNVE